MLKSHEIIECQPWEAAQEPRLGSLCFLEKVTGAWGGDGVVSWDRGGRGQSGDLGKEADASAYTK